jgi:hypothetical protein
LDKIKLKELYKGMQIFIGNDGENTKDHHGWDGPMDEYLNTIQIIDKIEERCVRIEACDEYIWHIDDLFHPPVFDGPIISNSPVCLFDENEIVD